MKPKQKAKIMLSTTEQVNRGNTGAGGQGPKVIPREGTSVTTVARKAISRGSVLS